MFSFLAIFAFYACGAVSMQFFYFICRVASLWGGKSVSCCLCCALGATGFSCAVSGFGQVLKSDPREKPLDQSAIPLIAPVEPITTPLIPKHPESGCSADWFPGDIECFKCSDWITITIGAWSERGWFEGDKDQIQIIQAQITYVFTFWDMKN